uniref:Uncharacterized protein n=1 Tax=Rhizophora mucronata TaxID=61149 RepID=A0A2P2N748_RHIMU
MLIILQSVKFLRSLSVQVGYIM